VMITRFPHPGGRRYVTLAALILPLAIVVGCSDEQPTTSPPADSPAAAVAASPRERLTRRLALALADPAVRQDLADRLHRSSAPEGKLQFQALTRTADQQLLARLATVGEGGMAALLADLDAARGLEVYLPVPAHRAAWSGDDHLLVATVG